MWEIQPVAYGILASSWHRSSHAYTFTHMEVVVECFRNMHDIYTR